MAQNKTTENNLSVIDFLNTVTDETKRKDCFNLSDTIAETTGFTAKMWGAAIVGFGRYHYKYESGRAGDAPLVGFSPRKDAIALYFHQILTIVKNCWLDSVNTKQAKLVYT